MQLRIHIIFAATNHATRLRLFYPQAQSRRVCLEISRLDYDGLGLLTFLAAMPSILRAKTHIMTFITGFFLYAYINLLALSDRSFRGAG